MTRRQLVDAALHRANAGPGAGRRPAANSTSSANTVGVLAIRDDVVPAIGNLANPVPGCGSNNSIVLRKPSKETT